MVGRYGQGMIQRINNFDSKLLSSPSDPIKVTAKKKNRLKYDSSADISCLYTFSDYAKCVCLVDNFDLLRED